ncbi:GGDEF domain-containing protein [Actinoplanes sp. NPDC049802]|uniref:GGDEF domain-containing protein n=1 Tax=Actinoplanes sp. NPDC049802 TaxID=3154742 RepID=UPI0034030508
MRQRQICQSAVAVAAVAVTVIRMLSEDHGATVATIVMIMMTALGVASHARAARRLPAGRASGRGVWMHTTAAMVCWLIGEATSAAQLFGSGHAVGRTVFGHVVNIAAFALAIGAMLSVPTAPATGAARWRMVLDGAVAATGLFTFTWSFALTRLRAQGLTGLDYVFDVIYPVAAVAVLAVALLLLAGGGKPGSSALTYLAGGVTVACVSLLYEVFGTAAGWNIRPLLSGGLLLAAGLIALAPSVPLPAGDKRAWEPSTAIGQALPYLPILALLLAALVTAHRTITVDVIAVWSATLMVGAVLARQLLSLRLTRHLSESLERERSRLAHEAFHDRLTALPNRAMVADRLARLDAAPVPGTMFLMLDLDGFKEVNDTLGHAAGDLLLREVAQRLLLAVPPTATEITARLGGDEFAIILVGAGRNRAEDSAARIIRALTVPIEIVHRSVTVGGSVGIAELHRPSSDTGELMRHADIALYAAKRAGKGCLRHYEPAWRSSEPAETPATEALAGSHTGVPGRERASGAVTGIA